MNPFKARALAPCREALHPTEESGDALYPFIRLHRAAFCRWLDISVDYAVLEHTNRAAVVPLDAGWSDVGSWSALWEAGARDAEGNVTQADVLLEEVRNTLVDAGKSNWSPASAWTISSSSRRRMPYW